MIKIPANATMWPRVLTTSTTFPPFPSKAGATTRATATPTSAVAVPVIQKLGIFLIASVQKTPSQFSSADLNVGIGIFFRLLDEATLRWLFL